MLSQYDSQKTVRLATRGSALALWQAERVRAGLARRGKAAEILVVRTEGDVLRGSLADAGGKGLFVRKIQEKLLRGEADIAVHSLKDMPALSPRGLVLAGVLRRADPRDALVSRRGLRLGSLPRRPKIGTGSPRRDALLRRARPDVRVVPIRGNVPTRVKLVQTRRLDAVVLASAGLDRLGLSAHIAERLPLRAFVPAPGQGLIALECRARDRATLSLLKGLTHPPSWTEARAERALLAAVGGDCSLPLGGVARVRGKRLVMHGFLAVEGVFREARLEGSASSPEALGRTMAKELLRR